MISADVTANKNKKKQKIWWLYLTNFCINWLPSKLEMGYSRKNPNSEGLRIYFSESAPRNFQICHFTLRNSGENKPWKSAKLCDTPWKFQGQNPRPMEIPHQFFLSTPGNSTSFLIDPWNFHILFFQYPWKFYVLNPPCFGFFLNSPIHTM